MRGEDENEKTGKQRNESSAGGEESWEEKDQQREGARGVAQNEAKGIKKKKNRLSRYVRSRASGLIA